MWHDRNAPCPTRPQNNTQNSQRNSGNSQARWTKRVQELLTEELATLDDAPIVAEEQPSPAPEGADPAAEADF